MTWVDLLTGETAWRTLNALFGLHALVLLTLLMKKHWKKSDVHIRFLMQALACFLLATIVGSVESIIQDNPIGLRTSLFTVATLWAALGLIGYDKKNEVSPQNRT